MKRNAKRNGAAIFDVIVAAGLVLATLAIATPLVVGSARVWKQTRNVQIACDEMSAKMDWLVSVSSEQRQAAMKDLSVSKFAQQRLIEATLNGEVIEDKDGKRIKLQINWRRRSNPPPLTLIAWVLPLDQTSTESDESGQESTQEDPETGETS